MSHSDITKQTIKRNKTLKFRKGFLRCFCYIGVRHPEKEMHNIFVIKLINCFPSPASLPLFLHIMQCMSLQIPIYQAHMHPCSCICVLCERVLFTSIRSCRFSFKKEWSPDQQHIFSGCLLPCSPFLFPTFFF